jgi:hypothetical protein
MLELRGVIVFGVRGSRVAWSRMYLEPVEREGAPLAAFVQPLPAPLSE